MLLNLIRYQYFDSVAPNPTSRSGRGQTSFEILGWAASFWAEVHIGPNHTKASIRQLNKPFDGFYGFFYIPIDNNVFIVNSNEQIQLLIASQMF